MVAKIIDNLEISKWVVIAYRWVGLAYRTVSNLNYFLCLTINPTLDFGGELLNLELHYDQKSHVFGILNS